MGDLCKEAVSGMTLDSARAVLASNMHLHASRQHEAVTGASRTLREGMGLRLNTLLRLVDGIDVGIAETKRAPGAPPLPDIMTITATLFRGEDETYWRLSPSWLPALRMLWEVDQAVLVNDLPFSDDFEKICFGTLVEKLGLVEPIFALTPEEMKRHQEVKARQQPAMSPVGVVTDESPTA
eukprot:CAMPEP_0206211998 /NCGR_PEP_ID=MMETSP0047_2-20121206/311_1 /ASSEMBLY_ACC=CAM_ASM_000192 /TAXON_ID=195065 /ORGANISM="Chroomonas mesostigmatica_cf, Strain CCMP1168" /LENGTH=180 /DNA_ID=CAMNT_0053633965 /DNA_START=1 /DNA_END=543 /DNA_ORIENTATION=-